MARILLIEDDKLIRRSMGKLLERKGHQVLSAEHGLEGVKLYEEHPVDVVITDILMDVQDGLETISYLRKHYPQAKIIAISGGMIFSADFNYLEHAKAMGADLTFKKPLETDQLLEAISSLLSS